jgi:hypothetical protein
MEGFRNAIRISNSQCVNLEGVLYELSKYQIIRRLLNAKLAKVCLMLPELTECIIGPSYNVCMMIHNLIRCTKRFKQYTM